jgi:hypothetical protein
VDSCWHVRVEVTHWIDCHRRARHTSVENGEEGGPTANEAAGNSDEGLLGRGRRPGGLRPSECLATTTPRRVWPPAGPPPNPATSTSSIGRRAQQWTADFFFV